MLQVKGIGAGVTAIALSSFIAGNAMAISFGGYTGGVRMKLQGVDEGTLYSTALPDGTYGGTGNVAVDIATLNALPQTAPRPNNPNTGDTWGVFQIREITNATGTQTLYNHATASSHLVGIFWGLQDTKLEIFGGGFAQRIAGVGVHTAVFEVPVGTYDVSGGAAAPGSWAGGNPVYPTITTGNLLWTWSSVPGFNALDPVNEFFTLFLPQGLGSGIASASGGWTAEFGAVPYWGVGPGNDLFESALEVNFTAEADPVETFGNKWLLSVDDPIRARVRAIPEPTSAVLGLAGLLAAGMAGTRRRRIA